MFITPYILSFLSDSHPNKWIGHTSLFRGLQQIIQLKKKKSLKGEINWEMNLERLYLEFINKQKCIYFV